MSVASVYCTENLFCLQHFNILAWTRFFQCIWLYTSAMNHLFKVMIICIYISGGGTTIIRSSVITWPKNKKERICTPSWQHVKAVKYGNNCTVNKLVMILMIVSAFKAATGYNAHLDEHCFLTKWADPFDPWHGTGMLTRSAICSPLLPSGSVMSPYSENTPGEHHQCHGETILLTCAHIHTLFCSYLAGCIRVRCSSNLYWNWQMLLMFVLLTAESF